MLKMAEKNFTKKKKKEHTENILDFFVGIMEQLIIIKKDIHNYY